MSRARSDLFLVSLLILFLELACIRWLPAHVLYLTFFTNTVLLAAFLGMSLGCLAASRPQAFLKYTPALLLVTMIAAIGVGIERSRLESVFRVGNPASPQLVFFGTEYGGQDPTRFFVPIEVVEAFFFVSVALVMFGPGQELGRAFTRVADRLQAYSLNILGSLVGIVLFAVCSELQLSPPWWFAFVAIVLGYLLLAPSSDRPRASRVAVVGCLAAIVAVTFWTSGPYRSKGEVIGAHIWSPYYRIDYDAKYARQLNVNLIAHQIMVARDDKSSPSYAYSLPHLLQRDAGGRPFDDVLVIGAGSGNDLSRALAFGAKHIDAVEIDPAIQKIGRDDHPDHPYQDPRVSVHIGDGRNFLRVGDGQYDLIVFALVDSLVLHSGYSNIRLESFMFTREAFADVKRHLKPGGVFVISNYFRQGWIVARLKDGLADTFGGDPLVLTLPYTSTIDPENSEGLTMLLAGNTGRIRDAFGQSPAYRLAAGQAPSPATPNGFGPEQITEPADRFVRLGLARVVDAGAVRPATDDWPFLYLREPMIPSLSLRGMAIMGGLALAMFAIVGRGKGVVSRYDPLPARMFFLGAGFMLIETKAVVDMALLFGSTWMVNTVVFAGVLIMVLAANLFVSRARPASLVPYYVGVLLALALTVIVPMDAFLGLPRVWQIAGASLLAFAPMLFAGVIFAVSFSRSAAPDRDFGANVAGAMTGGLAENASMLLGFRYLGLLVIAMYGLSWVLGARPDRR
ncbi:MAG TPA: methyltransferase domain-containing protein [Vicinamibacterales bacterium]|nr:methyltransferase domain-containing protein [Vicinamibacterales bacterium]